jgi:hypothetical protein
MFREVNVMPSSGQSYLLSCVRKKELIPVCGSGVASRHFRISNNGPSASKYIAASSEQFREAGSAYRVQEFPNTLRNPKLHYRVHRGPVTGPCPEPDESDPHDPILFIYYLF